MTLSIAGAAFKKPSALPGFAPTLGFTLFYLSLIVLLPLGALVAKASGLGLGGLRAVAVEPRVLAALKTSFGAALAAASIDVVFGAIVAWTLTRYRFPGRRLVDALVDLPFALPTAVAGISLAALYAPNGWLGAPLAALGVVALTFVGLPFVVRTVQPLIEELDRELEEASATLGASRLRTLARIALPPLVPGLLAGLALAFARGVGEYGSVIFIAGNVAYVSEIAPLVIVVKLEEYDYVGATGVAAIMLGVSFLMLLAINLLHAWSRRGLGHV
jgi:sulfate transport system permease protein